MAQVDIDGIKTAIKSIFDLANTTTGSPIDLSAGLANRVQRVTKLDPSRTQIQANWFPYIAMSVVNKDLPIEESTISKNQTTAKRLGVLNIDIAAATYEPFFTDLNEDQGAENTEKLMENIEEVLRANPTLNATVLWSWPTGVAYGDVPFDEQNHLRAGILSLECKVYY